MSPFQGIHFGGDSTLYGKCSLPIGQIRQERYFYVDGGAQSPCGYCHSWSIKCENVRFFRQVCTDDGKGLRFHIGTSYIFSSDQSAPVTYEATKPTTLLRMSPATLRHLMNTNEQILMNFIQLVSNACGFLIKKVHMLTLHTVREKVAIFLLEEATRYNSDTFTLTRSRQEIADLFAIQKFSLQRSLKEFANEGVISLNGKNIEILNKSALLAYTE